MPVARDPGTQRRIFGPIADIVLSAQDALEILCDELGSQERGITDATRISLNSLAFALRYHPRPSIWEAMHEQERLTTPVLRIARTADVALSIWLRDVVGENITHDTFHQAERLAALVGFDHNTLRQYRAEMRILRQTTRPETTGPWARSIG